MLRKLSTLLFWLSTFSYWILYAVWIYLAYARLELGANISNQDLLRVYRLMTPPFFVSLILFLLLQLGIHVKLQGNGRMWAVCTVVFSWGVVAVIDMTHGPNQPITATDMGVAMLIAIAVGYLIVAKAGNVIANTPGQH